METKEEELSVISTYAILDFINSNFRIKLREIENSKTEKLNNEISKNKTIIKPSNFGWFWKEYPIKEESAKKETQLAWNILCKEEVKPTIEVLKWTLFTMQQLNKRELAFIFGPPEFFIKKQGWNFHTLSYLKNQTSYKDLLKHPKWQRRRLEIMQRDNFRCTKCGNEETSLNVHHKRYLPNRKPWEYDDKDLITLCEECHENLSKK